MKGIMKWHHIFIFLASYGGTYSQVNYHVLDNTGDSNRGHEQFGQTVPKGKINTEHLTALVKDFGRFMNEQVENFTAFRYLGKIISPHVKENDSMQERNGKSLVHEIAGDISKLLKTKMKAVKELAKVVQDTYLASHYDEMIDFDYLNNKKLLSDDDLKLMGMSVENATKTYKYIHLVEDANFNNERINRTLSTIHVPTNVFDKASDIQNGVKWSKVLDEQFTKNLRKDDSLKWQYFCSSDGFFRIYPGVKWPKNNTDGRIDTFDCRMRSWYTKAAASPKNILVLVDSSGSMKGLRMKITHSTIDKILQTLSDEDHFNIIHFSAEPEYIDSNCTNRTFIHASESNKRRLLEEVKNINPKLKANFTKALIEAFELFREADEQERMETPPKVLCNKAIMLITDGAPESYEKVFKEYNWPNNKSVRVFTYLIGKEASDSRNAKWMANANRGYYTHISTLADVQENVQQYINVMSKPLALAQKENNIWTSVYSDYITETSDKKDKGLKHIVSYASPVYNLKGNHSDHKLLGVVGTDVTVKQIEDLIPYNRLGPNAYAFVVTHQGYVLFHPNYKPMYFKEGDQESTLDFHPDYRNVDITDVEYAVNGEQLAELRRRLLEGKSKEFTMTIKVPFDGSDDCIDSGKKRIMVQPYYYYFSKVGDTGFSLGIAITQKDGAKRAFQNIEHLDQENIRIAPWRYCKEEWKTLTDLKEIIKKNHISKYSNGTMGCSMYSDSFLAFDLDVIAPNMYKKWRSSASEVATGSSYNNQVNPRDVYTRFGIEQVFLWTFAGLTKFMTSSSNLTEPSFIDDNVKTVTNKYYRLTVQGVDAGYNHTYYYVPSRSENSMTNDTVVTITIPFTIKNFTILVVGLQMKYSHFLKHLHEAINNSMKYNAKPLHSPTHQHLSCYHANQTHCYILDNNGIIVYNNVFEDLNGNYLTDYSLMSTLIKKGFVIKEHYLTKQEMCKTEQSANSDSSAAFLLNPFKKLLSYLFWILTETVIFLFEYGMSFEQEYPMDTTDTDSEYTEGGAAPKCVQKEDVLHAHLKYAQLDKRHQNFLLRVYVFCKDEQIACAKRYTRYRLNYTKLREYRDSVFVGQKSECQYCKANQLMYRQCMQDMAIQCQRDYTVQWIENTNMMFVTVSAPNDMECGCAIKPPILDQEQHYEEKTKCEMILNKTAKIKTKGECIDSHPLEPNTESAVTRESSSIQLLLVCLLFIIANQKSVLQLLLP